MSAQILPARSTSSYSASSDDERKSVTDANEKGQPTPAPLRLQGEEDGYVGEEEEVTVGAVGLPWSKKGPALVLILLFVCEYATKGRGHTSWRELTLFVSFCARVSVSG